MSYEAILMSYSGPKDEDPSRMGFDTEDEAYDYICEFNCPQCVKDGVMSACAAEWEVYEEE